MEQEICTRILQFLDRRKGQVFEFELLPPSLLPAAGLPIVEDGPSFGISKRGLIQAFCTARTIFFKHLNRQEYFAEDTVFSVTSILLLFDPEHLTAANFRKRRLQASRDASGSREPQSQCQEKKVVLKKEVLDELVFLQNVLTSPLHRHTKSPTLWYHRRWVVKEFGHVILPAYAPSILTAGEEQASIKSDTTAAAAAAAATARTAFLESELNIVMKAAERHPKNYYAWNYARELISILPSSAQIPDSTSISYLQTVQTWCLSHASDTSGWSFLLFLLREDDARHAAPRVIQTVVDLTLDFNWDHEAVWVFLRTVLASSEILRAETREDVLKRISEKIGGDSKHNSNDDNVGGHITRAGHGLEISTESARGKAMRWIHAFQTKAIE